MLAVRRASLTIGTGLLFGLFPALHSTRPDLLPPLKGQSGQPSGARGAAIFRTSLATFQIAVSMALLIAAGLFVKSLFKVSRVDLGLKTDNVVTFGVSPQLNAYTPEKSQALFARIEEELGAQPGVTGVTSRHRPGPRRQQLGHGRHRPGIPDAGRTWTATPASTWSVRITSRRWAYRCIAGREFTPAGRRQVAQGGDRQRGVRPKKFNLGPDAVGKRMTDEEHTLGYARSSGWPRTRSIQEVKAAVPALFFRPYKQGDARAVDDFLRQDRARIRKQLVGQIPQIVCSGIDPNLPVEELRTLDEQVKQNVFMDRFISIMSTSFAVLATLLAAIGLMACWPIRLPQRTREIGLRMALGAAPARVRLMIFRQVGIMTVIGAAVGLLAAVWIARLAEGILFKMQGRDPVVFAGATLTLALVALAAGFIPAHRASKVDPMIALRWE